MFLNCLFFFSLPVSVQPIDTTGMTKDQKERLYRRRERNKAAATRCRVKRRLKSRDIRQELVEFSASNEELERELLQLQEEKQKLEAMLAAHAHVQHCRVIEFERPECEFPSPAASDCSASSASNGFFDSRSAKAISSLAAGSSPFFPARLTQRPPRLDFSSSH